MYYPVYGMMYIKDRLLLTKKSIQPSCHTIYVVLNHMPNTNITLNKNVLSVALIKIFLSSFLLLNYIIYVLIKYIVKYLV